MTHPDLVIFDCDGVLVDSEIIAARVDTELLAEAGIEIDIEDFIERYAGLTFTEAVMRIEKDYGVPLQASIIDRSKSILDQRLAAEVRAVPGAAEAVRGVPGERCVCSNSGPDRLDAMLSVTGLKSLFDGRIYSSRALPEMKPKPAPDVFLHAARVLGARPDATFVIEDTVHGVAGARAAGMRVIGFTGGQHSWPGHADQLTDAGAETVIRRFADLHPTIAALSQWAENV